MVHLQQTREDMTKAVLEENNLKEFIEKHIPKLLTVDAQDLVKWRKSVEKVRRIILEGVRYHLF